MVSAVQDILSVSGHSDWLPGRDGIVYTYPVAIEFIILPEIIIIGRVYRRSGKQFGRRRLAAVGQNLLSIFRLPCRYCCRLILQKVNPSVSVSSNANSRRLCMAIIWHKYQGFIWKQIGMRIRLRKPQTEQRKVPTGIHFSFGTFVTVQKYFPAPSTQLITRRKPPSSGRRWILAPSRCCIWGTDALRIHVRTFWKVGRSCHMLNILCCCQVWSKINLQ